MRPVHAALLGARLPADVWRPAQFRHLLPAQIRTNRRPWAGQRGASSLPQDPLLAGRRPGRAVRGELAQLHRLQRGHPGTAPEAIPSQRHDHGLAVRYNGRHLRAHNATVGQAMQVHEHPIPVFAWFHIVPAGLHHHWATSISGRQVAPDHDRVGARSHWPGNRHQAGCRPSGLLRLLDS